MIDPTVSGLIIRCDCDPECAFTEDTMSSSFKVCYRVSHHAASTTAQATTQPSQLIISHLSHPLYGERRSPTHPWILPGTARVVLPRGPSTFAIAEKRVTHSLKSPTECYGYTQSPDLSVFRLGGVLLSQFCKECAARILLMESHLINFSSMCVCC